jgi:hypothetical protein
MISTYVSVAVFSLWNGILVKLTQNTQKSTVRSIFLSIVSIYSFIILFFLSKLDISIAFLIIGIIISFSSLMFFIFNKKI